MKLSSTILLGEAQQKMSGYSVLMLYKLSLFSVEADPMALLDITVEQSLKLEDLAEVVVPNEVQFAIYPKEPEFLFSICKAISLAHPDYKIDLKTEESETDSNTDASEEESNIPQIIYCTMPEVNEDRRDKGIDYVKVIYEKTKKRIEEARASCEKKLVEKQHNDPKELDEARENLKEDYEKYLELCESQKKEKEESIENAYQLYLSKEKAKAEKEMEEKAAKRPDAGKSMKIDPFASFE